MPITPKQLLSSSSLQQFLNIRIDNEADIGEDLLFFIQKLKSREFSPQTCIVTEGETGESMYFIEQGHADVIKDSEGGKAIGRLAPGDFFGELSLISGGPRAATVRADDTVIAYELSKTDYEETIRKFPHLTSTILDKIYNRLTRSYRQIEQQNEQLKKSNQMRIELGTAFTYVILMISLYIFMLRIIQSEYFANLHVHFDIDYVFSRVMEVALLFAISLYIKKSSFTRKDLGLTLEGWKRSSLESIGISAIVIVLLYLLKWCSIEYGFDFVGDGQVLSLGYLNWNFGIYLIVAFLQELIARGVVQGSIHKLLIGRWAGATAVTVATFIFGLMHAHQPVYIIVASLLSGFLWGFMYKRHQTLVGVTISHFLVGNFAKLVGFWS